jgi:hypothetical protein
MPCFYFDVTVNGDGGLDHQGTELPNAKAAREEAMITAAEMAERLVQGDGNGDLAIRVRNEAGQPIGTVRLSLALEKPS